MSSKSNPGERQNFILDVLTMNPNAIYIDVFATYSENFAVSRKTFDKDWNKAKEQHLAIQHKVNVAKEATVIAESVKLVKNGLKTKHDRLMTYQKIVDKASLMLDEVDNTDDLRKVTQTIKDAQSEISKIEGDYASSKVDVNGLTINLPI